MTLWYNVHNSLIYSSGVSVAKVTLVVNSYLCYNKSMEGLLMSERTTPVRIKDSTLKALNKVAGEMQRESGDKISTDAAVWILIQRTFPAIAKEVEPERKRNEDKAS